MTACLTATIHSQGFPPSQRFSPRTSLRLYFTPLPLIGFLAFRAFPTRTSRDALRHPLLSCHWTPVLLDDLQALLHDPSTEIRTQALTSEPCSSLVSDTPNDRDLPTGAAALLTFALLETYQLVDRPETSPLVWYFAPVGCRGCPQTPFQGSVPAELGQRIWDYSRKSRSRLFEDSNLAQTTAPPPSEEGEKA